jgi:hypothetical protein
MALEPLELLFEYEKQNALPAVAADAVSFRVEAVASLAL